MWWAHGWVKTKGCWGTYPFHVVFTKVVSPPWSVLVQREGLRRGRQDSSLTFCSHQQRQTGAEPLNPPHNGWFCCSLAALQDPPQTLARTGSRRAHLTLSPLSVCFLGRTDGQTYRNLRLLPRKARWIYKLTILGRGDLILAMKNRRGFFFIPLNLAKLLLLMWLRGAVTAAQTVTAAMCCQTLRGEEGKRKKDIVIEILAS